MRGILLSFKNFILQGAISLGDTFMNFLSVGFYNLLAMTFSIMIPHLIWALNCLLLHVQAYNINTLTEFQRNTIKDLVDLGLVKLQQVNTSLHFLIIECVNHCPLMCKRKRKKKKNQVLFCYSFDIFVFVQGRKESWFIPTKLATNLSMSLSDTSSRKQVVHKTNYLMHSSTAHVLSNHYIA